MALVHYPALNRPEQPVCSVCIANFNGETLLVECLESVLRQECGFDIEVIVHDDASTDESVALIRDRFPQVELLVSRENVGFCISNNRMVSHARGTYVLLLNNDAALQPDALRDLQAAAEDLAAPAILTLPQYDWKSGALVDRGCLLDPFCNPIPNLDATRADVAYVIGACMWCPRDAWQSLGGFPEWMGSLAEDIYLCGVARLRGMPVRTLVTSGYRHRQGATFGGNRADGGLRTTTKRRRLSERNKTRALCILTPGLAVWPLLAIHLIALALEGLALCLLSRDTALWREVYGVAIATPFRDANLLRAERRVQMRHQNISLSQWFSTTRWQSRKLTLALRYGVPEVY